MGNIQEKVNYVKTNGFQIDFGDTMTAAFDKLKVLLGYGALAIFLYAIFSLIIQAIVQYAFGLGELEAQVQSEMQSATDFSEMMEIMQSSYLGSTQYYPAMLVQILLTALASPLLYGIIYLSYKYDVDGDVQIGDLFHGFNNPNFIRLYFMHLLSMLFMFLGLMAFVVGIFVVFVGMYMAPALILVGKMKTLDAIKSSFSMGFKQFFPILGIAIVGSLVGIAGVFLCGIGAFFTLPIVYILMYEVYKAAVGVDGQTEISTIGENRDN